MPRAAAALLSLVLAASPLSAQTEAPYEPMLVVSIKFGLTTHSNLWQVPEQPQAAPNSTFDTLDLARVLRPGIVGGLSATYYMKPKFGLSAEVTYFGVAGEQRCRGPAAYQADTLFINEQACTSANGEHVNTSVVGFLVGPSWRSSPQGRLQLSLRALVGPGLIGNSFVQTGGFILTNTNCTQGCRLILLDESDHPQFTFVIGASAGVTYQLSQGYRLRFDITDLITSLPVAEGPHPPTSSTAPTGSTMKHIPTFTFGLDMMLERRRGRRY